MGNDRAVAAAVPGWVTTRSPTRSRYLQPAALSHEIRPDARKERKELKESSPTLRDAAAAPRRDRGAAAPAALPGQHDEPADGGRHAHRRLRPAQPGRDPEEFYDTIKDADWSWLVVAMVISFLTNFATAVALDGHGADQRCRSADRRAPALDVVLEPRGARGGGMAAQIRFLQKQGVDLASAVASGGLLPTSATSSLRSCSSSSRSCSRPRRSHGEIPIDTIVKWSAVLFVIVLVIVAVGSILGVPEAPQAGAAAVKARGDHAWEALRSPRRVALLARRQHDQRDDVRRVLRRAASTAFGGSINFWTLLAINIFVGTLASLVPIPGGGTAVSSVGMSGALAAVGHPHRDRGRRGARQPARRQLHPRRPGLVGHQRPPPRRLPLIDLVA